MPYLEKPENVMEKPPRMIGRYPYEFDGAWRPDEMKVIDDFAQKILPDVSDPQIGRWIFIKEGTKTGPVFSARRTGTGDMNIKKSEPLDVAFWLLGYFYESIDEEKEDDW